MGLLFMCGLLENLLKCNVVYGRGNNRIGGLITRRITTGSEFIRIYYINNERKTVKREKERHNSQEI